MLIASPTLAAEPKDGFELLNKMSLTAESLDYSGEFVVIKQGKATTLRVIHSLSESGVQQKIMSLDGSLREIIQKDDLVACVLPDQGVGIREKKQYKQIFKLNVSSNLEDIKQHYTVTHIGQARVANRECDQLSVKPKDNYRYGYALCIDSEKGLLLRSELADKNGEILESYMFVNVSFGEVEPNAFSSATEPQSLDWKDDSMISNSMEMPGSGEQKWRVAENQSGFTLEHYIERVSPVLESDIVHLVLTDGLAKVSVFVSPLKASANKQKENLSMGSLNSFSKEIGENMITVIGEVPQQTVMIIAENTGLF